MELTDALSWLVGMSAAVALVVNLRHFGLRLPGWLFVHGVLLVVVVLAAVAKEPMLTFAAAGGWVLFGLGPLAARRRQAEFLGRLQFEEAARWARVSAWLHPFDGAPDQANYLLALGDMVSGRLDEARARLAELEKSARLGELARVELLRLDGDWAAIVARVEARRESRLDPMLVMPYLRALGELGETSRLLSAFGALPLPVRRLGGPRLTAVAFSGRPSLVRALFETHFTNGLPPARSYWLAVAEQAQGELASAKARLEGLLGGGAIAAQARERLRSPAPVVRAEALAPEAAHVLAELGREIEETRALPGAGAPRRPLATFALMAVLVLVFVGGALADGSPVEKAVRFGALVLPPELVGGAGWRVVSAGFVHANGTHLVMNLLGLWVLGRMLERSWGPFLLVVAFLGSSAGAYVIGLFFMEASETQPKLLLGASAGVLGLVGSLASFAAIGYFVGQNRLLGRRLRWAGLIVALQLVFDAFHPMVSSFLHLAGIACGVVLALPYALYTFRRKAT